MPATTIGLVVRISTQAEPRSTPITLSSALKSRRMGRSRAFANSSRMSRIESRPPFCRGGKRMLIEFSGASEPSTVRIGSLRNVRNLMRRPALHHGSLPVSWLKDKLALIVVAMGGTIVCLGAVCIFATYFSAPPRLENRPDARSHVLAGVASYELNWGWRICSRADIHHCRIRWGWADNSGFGTLEYPNTDIHGVANCETQTRDVLDQCRSAGPQMSDPWAVCVAQSGVIYRGERGVQVDPREPTVPANRLRIECDEGHQDFSFSGQR